MKIKANNFNTRITSTETEHPEKQEPGIDDFNTHITSTETLQSQDV